ncbi:MAG: imidazole glycerol phosphate synthase subunit HisH [Sandaracinaceae bacterium]
MKRVVLVDTSMGNLRSVARALDRAGAEVTLSADPEAVRGADRVVVPGQGHFRDCAKALAGGLGEALRAHVDAGRPYLGICLGMQILFERSEEAEDVAGLGLFPGAVRRFADDLVDSDGRALKVPHMGWNVVRGAHPLLDPEAWLYFVHSYHCVPADPSLTVGTAEYGAPFCAAIAKDNVFACQFHPEKSQRAGARVLERFLEDAWS